jgi:cysteine sulfinate desulfinase/cysteine desulfurase-like protein
VLDVMLPYLREHFGNPSSDHVYGYRAREAVATARAQLATLLGVDPAEVIFTGGGSEANNLALGGVAASRGTHGAHIITSAIEHPAVREPYIRGAGHERGLRAGTENVASIAGLGRAAELAGARLEVYYERTRRLRNALHDALLADLPDAVLNGHRTERLPNTLNLSFPGVNAAALLAHIRDEVTCSTGSACHAGHAEPSSVLLAMGRDSALAALRLSLGWDTTETDIQRAAAVITAAVHRERA